MLQTNDYLLCSAITDETEPPSVSSRHSTPLQESLDVADQAHDYAGTIPTSSTPPKVSRTTGSPSPSNHSATPPGFLIAGEAYLLHHPLTVGS
jgi:hypothetical protein